VDNLWMAGRCGRPSLALASRSAHRNTPPLSRANGEARGPWMIGGVGCLAGPPGDRTGTA